MTLAVVVFIGPCPCGCDRIRFSHTHVGWTRSWRRNTGSSALTILCMICKMALRLLILLRWSVSMQETMHLFALAYFSDLHRFLCLCFWKLLILDVWFLVSYWIFYQHLHIYYGLCIQLTFVFLITFFLLKSQFATESLVLVLCVLQLLLVVLQLVRRCLVWYIHHQIRVICCRTLIK